MIYSQIILSLLSVISYCLIYKHNKYSYIVFILQNTLAFYNTNQYYMLINIGFCVFFYMRIRAVKKPIVVDVFTLPMTTDNIKTWCTQIGISFEKNFFVEKDVIRVKTKEGHSYVLKNTDYIICGINKECYPIDIKIFNDTYNIFQSRKNDN